MQTRHELLETFSARFRAYAQDSPGATGADLSRFADVLIAATPGLSEAPIFEEKLHEIVRAFISDRGQGLPAGGPSAEFAEGDRVWKIPEQWTAEDFRVTLAWWQSYPGPDRATRLAALIAYGESRWPWLNLARQPWPDITDLPAWSRLLP
jgi:hypothetical protein